MNDQILIWVGINVGIVISLLWIHEMPWYWFWTNYILAAIFATAIHSLGHRHWSGTQLISFELFSHCLFTVLVVNVVIICCSGRWFRAHTLEHHIKYVNAFAKTKCFPFTLWFDIHAWTRYRLYPPSRFTDKVVKVSADPNAKYYIPVIVLPFVLTWYMLRSIRAAVVSTLEILLWLWFVDYLHMGYHLDK
jgi:ABC-type dipeptide/oligopeptide/nickel transport system permease component